MVVDYILLHKEGSCLASFQNSTRKQGGSWLTGGRQLKDVKASKYYLKSHIASNSEKTLKFKHGGVGQYYLRRRVLGKGRE